MSKKILLEILNRELEKATNVVIFSRFKTTDTYEAYWQGRMMGLHETIQTVNQVIGD